MSRHDANKNETRGQIKRTFLDHYIKNGLEKTSISALCKSSGVSRTTFYEYFDDKYSVLEAIEDELLKTLRDINKPLLDSDISHSSNSAPFPILIDALRFIHSNKAIFKMLLSKNGDPNFIYRWEKDIKTIFHQKFLHDQLPLSDTGVPEQILASSYIGLYKYWLFNRDDLSCEDLSSLAGKLTLGWLYHFDNIEK